jgi:hypothetical protein
MATRLRLILLLHSSAEQRHLAKISSSERTFALREIPLAPLPTHPYFDDDRSTARRLIRIMSLFLRAPYRHNPLGIFHLIHSHANHCTAH